jgi:AcrR family transcriptional regulator
MATTNSPSRATGPIFPKLRSGPGGMSREQIASHQSARLKGAMVESVARHGYAGTTLRELVTLAGVSKTTFYQLYESKQDCFLATFDEIIRVLGERVGEAFRSGGDLRERLTASLRVFMDTAIDEPAAARLAAVEALTLGAAGVEHRQRASRAFEVLVQQSFDHSPSDHEVSPTAVRAIVAGIRGVVYRRLRANRAEELPGTVEEIVDWALSYQAAPGEATRRAIAAAERPLDASLRVDDDDRPSWDEPPDSRRSRAELSQRERIVRAAARVSVEHGYETLSIPTITSAAGISNQTFYEHFSGKRDAFLAAFEIFGTEVLGRAAAAYAAQPDQATGIAVGTKVILEQVVANELLARLSFFELPAAGPIAFERADAILDGFGAMLAPWPDEANRRPPTQVLTEAIPSGVWEVVQHEIANGRLASLPELAPEITRLALMPFDVHPDED